MLCFKLQMRSSSSNKGQRYTVFYSLDPQKHHNLKECQGLRAYETLTCHFFQNYLYSIILPPDSKSSQVISKGTLLKSEAIEILQNLLPIFKYNLRHLNTMIDKAKVIYYTNIQS